MKSIEDTYKSTVKSEINIEDHAKVINGSIYIKSEESFRILTDYILTSPNGKYLFIRFLEQNDVESLYAFYTNFPEETIMKFIEARSIPAAYDSYFLFTEDDGEITLERNVQSTFLRLYFNKDMHFFIDNDQIKMEGHRLFRYSKGEKTELVSKQKTLAKNGKLKATGDYKTYEGSNGKMYRLKVESDTKWGEVTLNTPTGYKDFWNHIEYWAHHRRRNLGVWWASDADEIWVEGSHWWANPANNQYEHQIWSPGKLYNTNEAPWAGTYVHTYTYTGHCKGRDGNYHSVTISETN